MTLVRQPERGEQSNNLRMAPFRQYACVAHLIIAQKRKHARRLAEVTIQPNVEELLRSVADGFDCLADDVANPEVDFYHREIREHS